VAGACRGFLSNRRWSVANQREARVKRVGLRGIARLLTRGYVFRNTTRTKWLDQTNRNYTVARDTWRGEVVAKPRGDAPRALRRQDSSSPGEQKVVANRVTSPRSGTGTHLGVGAGAAGGATGGREGDRGGRGHGSRHRTRVSRVPVGAEGDESMAGAATARDIFTPFTKRRLKRRNQKATTFATRRAQEAHGRSVHASPHPRPPELSP
jgi:hypothetical protein